MRLIVFKLLVSLSNDKSSNLSSLRLNFQDNDHLLPVVIDDGASDEGDDKGVVNAFNYVEQLDRRLGRHC